MIQSSTAVPTSQLLAVKATKQERIQYGDWEVDTIVGKNRKSGLVTFVDRKSRFLKCAKVSRLSNEEVAAAMITAFRDEPVKSITSDRGREFQLHGNVTRELGVEFYFPPPH